MGPLAPDTPLARFSASKSDFRSETAPRVKDRFMLPRPDPTAGWALSTLRVDGLPADEKRLFGEQWVLSNMGPDRTLRAHCELPTAAFETVGLRPDFDDHPPRHVNVLGWPDETDARLAIAHELCALIEIAGHVERYV